MSINGVQADICNSGALNHASSATENPASGLVRYGMHTKPVQKDPYSGIDVR